MINDKPYLWAVVGAGPAGIAAVGKLLDHAIAPSDILWIDPSFSVGDFQLLWKNISSNTTVALFTRFLHAVNAFDYQNAPDFALNHLSPDDTCALQYMAEPLQWITSQLQTRVNTQQTLLRSMTLAKRQWNLQCDLGHFIAKNVILATGAVPTVLPYSDINTMAFDIAIDKNRLQSVIDPKKTYAVFGASHSAIIIIRHLVELNAKKVVNFYRSPCRYAINMGDYTLFDNTGLKGQTALWARNYIDGTWPSNLIRYPSNESSLANYLPECDEAIYAVGFSKRNTVAISGYNHDHYDPHVGIIGPGLFGFGIAYPEIKTDNYGCVEAQVGLWKFMLYLQKVLPVWLNYST